ncbi:MAG: NADH-quinone oxidoreductase subunit H, partial [Anaerolineaceae bacterium]|nr:NADH-quinone oxidoreductase subunit H [Anaerolineaceae bacterium]
FNIEYSGLKFGMFYVGEFLHAFTGALLFVTVFLGGYRGPFVNQFPLIGIVYLLIKTFFVYFFSILFRGALPRFRMDQMLDLNWKVLTPLAIAIVFLTALVDKAFAGLGQGPAVQELIRVVVMLVLNLAIFWLAARLMAKSIHTQRQVVSQPRPLATMEGPANGQGGLSG